VRRTGQRNEQNADGFPGGGKNHRRLTRYEKCERDYGNKTNHDPGSISGYLPNTKEYNFKKKKDVNNSREND
jgi:hypothetical protein